MIKNLINIHDASAIINHLEIEFDSHVFIKEFRFHHEQDYLAIAERYRIDAIRKANSLIARFLSANQNNLNIEKTDRRTSSNNVNGNKTSCAKWRKN